MSPFFYEEKMMQVFLIGFMGVGKTTLGKQLADLYNLPFYDLDDEIEQSAKLSIPNIFAELGEKYFRELESEILLTWEKPGIISCGGGVVELSANRAYFQAQDVILLQTDFSMIWNRIEDSSRPLVKQWGKQGMENLYQVRKPKYQACTELSIDTSKTNALQDLKNMVDNL